MRAFYCLAATLALAPFAPASAQTAAPLTPVQTIALGPQAALGGTVRLPNHHTVLLLTDAQAPTIQARCLTPAGQTAWETNLDRYQKMAGETSSFFAPLNGVALTRGAKSEKEQEELRRAALLDPVEVLTNGNELLLVERIREETVKKQPKTSTLRTGQLYVQRLDDGGKVTKVLFEPRPEPADRKTEAEVLGRYADAAGYVEIVRETNKREETPSFFLVHYNLATKASSREPLPLPATPPAASGVWRHWQAGWAYLGHRPNQTYFYRLTLTDADQPKQKAGSRPVAYQVYIADDQGAAAGGFTTLLGLPKGTISMYSGQTGLVGEAEHIPTPLEQMQSQRRANGEQANTYTSSDAWDLTTSGFGTVYLDHATGDVLIFGEYNKGSGLDPDDRNLAGMFGRRYSAQGQLVAQTDFPYSEAVRANRPKDLFKGGGGALYRVYSYGLDPLNGQSHFGLTARSRGPGDHLDLFFDQNLKLTDQQYIPEKGDQNRPYTAVLYAAPHWLHKRTGLDREVRLYEHAVPTDLPIYTALEGLRRAAGPKADTHELHLSATGPGTGLVIERLQDVGGTLKVYRF